MSHGLWPDHSQYRVLTVVFLYRNRNAVVRARNGTVVRGDMVLLAPHSVITGEVIAPFPDNVDQLERLHGELTSSHIAVPCSPFAKRERWISCCVI